MPFDPNDWQAVTEEAPASPTAPTAEPPQPDYFSWNVPAPYAKERMSSPFIADLSLAATDFYNMYGRPLRVNQGFRTFEDQKRIYDSGVRPAAKPGFSRHEKGEAVDIDPRDVADFSKLPLDTYGLETLARINDPVHIQWRKERMAGAIAAAETPDEVKAVEAEASVAGFEPAEWEEVSPTAKPTDPKAMASDQMLGAPGGPLEQRVKGMQESLAKGETPLTMMHPAAPVLGAVAPGIFGSGAGKRLEAEKYGFWSGVSDFTDFMGKAVDVIGKGLDRFGAVSATTHGEAVSEPTEFPKLSDATGFAEHAYGITPPKEALGPIQEALKPVTDYLKKSARQVAPTGKPPEDFEDKVLAGIAGMPGVLAKYAIPVGVLGPALGMAVTDMVGASDKDPGEVIVAGVEGAITGKILGASEVLTLPSKMATGAGLFGFLSWARGGDTSDIASATAVGGFLMASSGKGNVSASKALSDALNQFKKEYFVLPKAERESVWSRIWPSKDKVQEDLLYNQANVELHPEEQVKVEAKEKNEFDSKMDKLREQFEVDRAAADREAMAGPGKEPTPTPEETEARVVDILEKYRQGEIDPILGEILTPEQLAEAKEGIKPLPPDIEKRIHSALVGDRTIPRPDLEKVYDKAQLEDKLVDQFRAGQAAQEVPPTSETQKRIIDRLQREMIEGEDVTPMYSGGPDTSESVKALIEKAKNALAKARGIDPSKLDYIGDMTGFRENRGLYMFNINDPSRPDHMSTISWPKMFGGGPDTTEFMKKYAPTFYSRTLNFLEKSLGGKGTGEGFANTILGWAKKGIPDKEGNVVHKEELKWSGLIPWLQEQKGPVTKQQVLDYLREEGQVEVREVERKSGFKEDPRLPELEQEVIRLQTEKSELLNKIAFGPKDELAANNQRLEVINDRINDLNAEIFSARQNQFDQTKFRSYMQLPPGGENYREYLLTVPDIGIENVTAQQAHNYLRNKNIDIYQKGYSIPERLKDDIDWEIERPTGEEPERKFAAVEYYDPETKNNVKSIYYLTSDQGIVELAHELGMPGEGFRVSSSHSYGDPAADINRFAHVFVDDRIIDGKKYLTVWEMQSDWAGKGRREGYRTELTSDEKARISELREKVKSNRASDEEQVELAELIDKDIEATHKVPEFPFSKTWHEVALKKMLRKAAEEGYDGVAWATGDMVKDRYDISKHADKVYWNKSADLLVVEKDGREILRRNNITEKELPELVGKDVAEKLMVEDLKRTTPQDIRSVSGLDLKIGGEWANRLYDETVPRYMNKLGKQWGARVEEKGISAAKGVDRLEIVEEEGGRFDVVDREDPTDMPIAQFDNPRDAIDFVSNYVSEAGKEPIHTFDLTPSQKESVLYKGQYMFSGGPDTSEWFKGVWGDVKESRSVRGSSLDVDSLGRAGQKIWDMLRGEPGQWTDYKALSNKYIGDIQIAGIENQRMIQRLTRTVPDRTAREAITNWIEAGGDPQLLKARADATKDPHLRKGYERALNLSERELDTAREVVTFYDKMLKEGQDAGVLEAAFSNYINHIWKKDSSTARRLQGEINSGMLNTNFSYARKRLWSTYFEGEQMGKLPKDKDFAYLMSRYFQSFHEAVAARQAIKSLTEGKTADGMPIVTAVGGGEPVPRERAEESRAFEDVPPDYDMTGKPEGPDAYLIKPRKLTDEQASNYRYVDHPALRKWKWIGNDMDGNPMLMQGDLWVHKDHYSHLKNMLSKSAIRQHPVGRGVMAGVQSLKGTLLAASPFHQVHVASHGIMHLVNIADLPEIDFSKPEQVELVRHGLMVYNHKGMQDFAEGVYSTGLPTKIPGIGPLVEKYGEYLFQGYIPRLKMKLGTEALERNLSRYSGKYDRDQILELTANQANAAFGELNYKAMGRNPTMQDVFRLIALAPDFLEARMRFVGQAFRPGGREQAYALMRGALGLYAAGVIGNMLFSDNHSAHWDKPFQLVIGNKSYSIRSVPGDILHLFDKPRNFVYWRLNPTTVRTGMEMVTGRDIYGRKRDFTDQVKDFFTSHMPIPTQPFLPGIRREQSLLDGALRTIGIGSQKYKTAADQAMMDYFQEMRVDRPARSEQIEISKARTKVLDLARAGKEDEAVKVIQDIGGKYHLDPKKALNWLMEAQYPENVANFRRLPLEVMAKVMNLAEPEEELAFAPILVDKVRRASTERIELAMPELERYIERLERRRKKGQVSVEPKAEEPAPMMAPPAMPEPSFSILNQ